jgi:hypothetical protein
MMHLSGWFESQIVLTGSTGLTGWDSIQDPDFPVNPVKVIPDPDSRGRGVSRLGAADCRNLSEKSAVEGHSTAVDEADGDW